MIVLGCGVCPLCFCARVQGEKLLRCECPEVVGCKMRPCVSTIEACRENQGWASLDARQGFPTDCICTSFCGVALGNFALRELECFRQARVVN